jgi:hypothetical protein
MCLFYDNFLRCRSTILYHFHRNKYAYGFLKHICQLWIIYYSRTKSRNVKGLDMQTNKLIIIANTEVKRQTRIRIERIWRKDLVTQKCWWLHQVISNNIVVKFRSLLLILNKIYFVFAIIINLFVCISRPLTFLLFVLL